MAWLARSIANSLNLDDNDDDTNPKANVAASKSPPATIPDADQNPPPADSPSSAPSTPSARGVKDDLSELKKTLTRQLWGVASFLAPPPESSPPRSPQISRASDPEPSDDSDPKVSDEDLIAGIRSDFAEIGGRFKSGISKLSNNMAVSEFSKIASSFLQFGSEEEELEARNAIGVTEEVLAFARNIAMHPETWLDFPLPDDDDSDDFELSDAQQEHALAVERLAPRLAALRMEFCPGHMSESYFWKIYFVLLHPRLNKHDAELLSTPEIVEARAMLTQESQNQGKVKTEKSSETGTFYPKEIAESPKEQHLSVPASARADLVPVENIKSEAAPPSEVVDLETEKHPTQITEIEVMDKIVVAEGPVKSKHQEPTAGSSSKVLDDKYEDDGDDWLKEEDNSENVGVSGTSIPIGNEDDVSFSDLEEDDDGDVPVTYKKTASGSDSSTKDSRDWVQLSGSSAGSEKEINSAGTRHAGNKEANDWLDIDDLDVM
ncbi:hypothetical protein UlMin_038999 [Ulmus minor]